MGVSFYLLKQVKEAGPDIPYSGFGEFRRLIAEQCGFNLLDMKGFNRAKNYQGKEWNKEDTLTPFFDHSDCDGEWTTEELERIAQPLRENVEQLDSIRYQRFGLELCDIMDQAIAEGGTIELH